MVCVVKIQELELIGSIGAFTSIFSHFFFFLDCLFVVRVFSEYYFLPFAFFIITIFLTFVFCL